MKKSSWKKFFTRSRSKSASRAKKGQIAEGTKNQNPAPSSLANEKIEREPVISNVTAEKLNLQVANLVNTSTDDGVDDAAMPPKQASRMGSSTSQPRSSTNEDFMTEEIDSQNLSVNSLASEKPIMTANQQNAQELDQNDLAAVENRDILPGLETSDEVNPATATNAALTNETDALTPTEEATQQDEARPPNQENQDNSQSDSLQAQVFDRDSGNESDITREEIVAISRERTTSPGLILQCTEQCPVKEVSSDSQNQVDDPQDQGSELQNLAAVVQDGNPRTASDDEAEFAVDRNQPQQLSKLDVLGADLHINPNYSVSDDSQHPTEQTFDVTNNFVTTDYTNPNVQASLGITDLKGGFVLKGTDTSSSSSSTEAALVLELPQQLLNSDDGARGTDSVRGPQMLFFSGAAESSARNDNVTSVLFFGPQVYQNDDLLDKNISYQVANGRHFDEDSGLGNQSKILENQARNDGQSPPSVEDEQEDQTYSRDIEKRM